MFEKSLYDLIRGLRNHKGTEKEYILGSIRECRKEIRSQDMDLKATALLKLTYLEMFGHDMSWASFNVLEVMSSQKYHQKRIGYLAGVQSFRPDTEVLMLAENLLKKDIMSPQPTVISLPLATIPHVTNPTMANSLLSDLLPRLTHTNPNIRKKTAVTLYRLALVYPETLRAAWPRIKERLLDEDEDPGVTSAVVNVVCELGWRRPHDFLPLAPRLFELLVEGSNNWMAIKIIKLFATLTPLEPRLVKKLLPPLTNLIKTTPAMSLLYECINGIIQGGILDGSEGNIEGEDIARLCVNKLRGMLVIEGDPNLKYVALLAFNRIVKSHSHLVSLQQDAILECIDDPDISIRTQALDLVVGMVNSDTLTATVGRLMRQLRYAPVANPAEDNPHHRPSIGVEPAADSDDEDPEESLRRHEKRSDQPPPLPEDYRVSVIKRILEMCSRDTYANVVTFEWYIDVLVQLVRVSPSIRAPLADGRGHDGGSANYASDISYDIGEELRNVAVRVKSVRLEATEAAQSLVLVEKRDQMFPVSGNGGQGALEAAAWVVGEYAHLLSSPHDVLSSLMHPGVVQLPPHMVAVYIQALPKVFASLTWDQRISWTPERKTMVSLLLGRAVHFLESLATHPSLEVQERAVEYLELMKLAAEAVSGHDAVNRDEGYAEPPLLLTQAIPSLFRGLDLNPVAVGAQKKVPLPEELDLDTPVNPNLQALLDQANQTTLHDIDEDPTYQLYYERPTSISQPETAAERLELPRNQSEPSTSYQQSNEFSDYLDPDIVARRKAERRERYRDDPYYIGGPLDAVPPTNGSGRSTPLGRILKTSNGGDDQLDIDAIPIMDLDLESREQPRRDDADLPGRPQQHLQREHSPGNAIPQSKRARRRNVEIMVDETIGADEDFAVEPSSRLGTAASGGASRADLVRSAQARGKRSLLEVDSSRLGALSLEDSESAGGDSKLDVERREAEEAEMVRLMKEVERARLEMQRAQERIQAREGEEEGVVVKKKKKKRRVEKAEEEEGEVMGAGAGSAEGGVVNRPSVDEGGEGVKKKKKKKKVKLGEGSAEGDAPVGDGEGDGVVKRKRKKKREPALVDADA